MQTEVIEDKMSPDVWRVESKNYELDGEVYVTTFSGPIAEQQAKAYATSMPLGRKELEHLFRDEVERWKTDTQHWSSVTRMLAHPSYLRIVGFARQSPGNEIERLLLQELGDEPDYWFDALAAITGEDPVQPQNDFDEAVSAWLKWGREKGIIGNEDHRAGRA